MDYTQILKIITSLDNLFKWKGKDWQDIKTILNFGYPISIAFLVEWGAATLMAFWAGMLELQLEQAALNFTSALNFFLIPVIVALGQAICYEVSKAIGEKMWGNAARLQDMAY